MKRYVLTIIMILASICLMESPANACTNDKPTSVISNPTEQYVGVYNGYTGVGKIAYLDGSASHDNDNGETGPGEGIVAWYWEAGKWDGSNYPTVGFCTGYVAQCTFPEPGLYQIRLKVKDNDDPTPQFPPNQNYFSPYDPGDAPYWSEHWATCYVYVFFTTITSNSNYSVWGSGKDFTYDVVSNGRWVPDETYFYITSWGTPVYHEQLSNTAVSNPAAVYSWNGKDYSDYWLDPGSYIALIEAGKKNGVSPYWYDYFEGLAQYYSPYYVWYYYGYDTEQDCIWGFFSTGELDTMPLTQIKLDLYIDIDGDGDIDDNDELGEENPGKYINVNWNDDDGDGWSPNDNPPNGNYTGDKDDPEISSANGDTDFREVILSMEPLYTIQTKYPNSKVKLTFPNKIKVWTTKTKKTAGGTSSELATNAEISINDLPKTLYIEGFSGSSSFKDVEFKATWTVDSNIKDTVRITVFEVDLTGFFCKADGTADAQQSDDEVHHSTLYGSNQKNGKISWDDSNGDGTPGGLYDQDEYCVRFHNCMECQGTVKPSGVTSQVEYNFIRKKWGKYWTKYESSSWDLVDDWTNPWNDDEFVNGVEFNDDEDLTPSNNNHIYDVDGPGYTTRMIYHGHWDSLAHIINFRERVFVIIDETPYQCSNYFKWHSQLYTKPKDSAYMTRDDASKQKLGSGWIEIPTNP